MLITDDEYKRAKEAFVADLQGTTGREVFFLFALMPGTQWLYSELLLLLEVAGMRTVGAGYFALPVTILVEFVVLLLPSMIAFTFTQYTMPLLAVVYFTAIVLNRLSWKHAREYVLKHCRKEKMGHLLEKELPFITCYRAQVILSTVFAILAVDFTIFPRRFAKTETFGFSVMDVGVGTFIVSSAIVSSYARSARPSADGGKRSQVQDRPKSFSRSIYNFLRPILPTVVLGYVRFLTVKGVNYQEHVSEYGVHWNFYFTLAGVYLLFSFLQVFGTWATSPVMAVLVGGGYQIYLTHFGGEEFMINAPRDDLFSQNREGILSLFGYTAIYIASVYGGRIVFGYMDSHGGKAVRNIRWLVVTLGMTTLVLVLATFLSVRLVSRPSRRMVNLPYVLWVLAESAFLLTVYAGVHVVSLLPRTPLLFQGSSRNQLFVFLIANLATGAVNLTMRTIYASAPTASAVLCIYMLVVSVLASVLEHAHIRIKL